MADNDQKDNDPKDDEDEGLFDLEDMVQEETSAILKVMKRINARMQTVGAQAAMRNEQMEEISDLPPARKKKALVEVLKDTAEDMNAFSKGLEPEIPEYKEHQDRMLRAFRRAVPILLELNNEDDLGETREAVDGMATALAGTADKLVTLSETTAGFPRLSTVVNRAKRQMIKRLEQLVSVMRDGQVQIETIQQELEGHRIH